VHLIVRGDASTTDLFIEVTDDDRPVFVSDVDGTLTTLEYVEALTLASGSLPEAHTGAAEALGALADRGYRPVYLTARPEWLTARTREFLAERGFPPGTVHTTLSLTGAVGAAAADFKTSELRALAERGLSPAYAFGNTESDAQAYDSAGIEPADHRVFYRFDDPIGGGRRIDSYADVAAELASAPSACP
jgi:phosphatidate phosphatase PAH1